MPLFDSKPRTNPSVMTHVEDMYSFLDRVDDPAFARIRLLLNDWFARYESIQPAKAANDVAGRIRSKQPLQFEGAFWELYLHEAHVRLGFDVATYPEDVRHPDFILTKGGETVYLEATVTGKSAGLPTDPRGTGQLYDWINSARDPNFFVRAEVLEAGETPPRRRQVTEPLEAWLQGLAGDWRRLRDEMENGNVESHPTRVIEVRSWRLLFEAFPKSEKQRIEDAMPMIGIYRGQAAWEGESAEFVRAKLHGKATHYGDLDAPMVVALHDLTPFASRGVMREALLGLERPYWTAGAGSANRVSAVLAASDFGQSSPARKTPELWLNTHATHSLRTDVLAWPVVLPQEKSRPGLDPAELFDLPRDWPGKPFEKLNS
jgi:hypothetical protein